MQGTRRPHRRNDPTNHDVWNPFFHIGPWNQNKGSLCLCVLMGPYITAHALAQLHSSQQDGRPAYPG